MNEKIELKPCPRCKAGVSIIRANGAKWVSCRCGIQSSRYGEHIDDERMIRDWDYRPVEDAQAARIAELEAAIQRCCRNCWADKATDAAQCRGCGLKTALKAE